MKSLRHSVIVAALLVSSSAHAVLGESRASIATVADALVATRHETALLDGAGLTLHRLQTDHGLEVREYIAESTGQVVGIAWSGTREPRRIATLLGSLTTEYVHETNRELASRRAPSERPRLRNPSLVIHSEHLVIERFSRMGLSRGRVYLAQLPPGVVADAIR